MSAYTPPRETNFIQISLSDFLESHEPLNPSEIVNGKLSQKDEILFIFSLVGGRALTKEELYEVVKFVEQILGQESIYGIPNQVTLSKLLCNLLSNHLIIQYDKAYEISKSGISSFKNSFQKSILRKTSLRRACRFLNCILSALLDRDPDISKLRATLAQATEFYSTFSGNGKTFE
ncbi:MAG: hypothetical protein ACFFCD_05330 [Promethearchaeota archaeon]